jgi:hypothetical protein
MTKNQLFKMSPPRTVCLQVLSAFGLSSFDDNHNFSRSDLETIGCVTKMEELKPILMEYYLPCKARTYLNDLNSKNIITILRQLVKLYDFSVTSREKYIKGAKFIIYQIVPINNRRYQPITISDNTQHNCIITFD